jgi:hypothetical protein
MFTGLLEHLHWLYHMLTLEHMGIPAQGPDVLEVELNSWKFAMLLEWSGSAAGNPWSPVKIQQAWAGILCCQLLN